MSREAVEAIGLIAGFFTSISSIPQIVRVVRERNAHGLSLATLLLFALGVALWLTYGVLTHALSVIVWNAVTLALYLLLIAMKLAARNHTR